MINRVDITVVDVNSCKVAVEVLDKGVSIVCLVVINMPNLLGRCQQPAHTVDVGHVTSTRYITLSTAPYYPL